MGNDMMVSHRGCSLPWEVLGSALISSSLGSEWPSAVSRVLPLPEGPTVGGIKQAFQIGFSHLVTRAQGSSTAFLPPLPSVVWRDPSLPAHLVRGILAASRFVAVTDKAALTTVCRFLCGHKYVTALGN